MHYHPLIGVLIFVFAIIVSFILGRFYIKKKLNLFPNKQFKKKSNLPKGEITSPDAPWLNKK